jgi:hypothetical protein
VKRLVLIAAALFMVSCAGLRDAIRDLPTLPTPQPTPTAPPPKPEPPEPSPSPVPTPAPPYQIPSPPPASKACGYPPGDALWTCVEAQRGEAGKYWSVVEPAINQAIATDPPVTAEDKVRQWGGDAGYSNLWVLYTRIVKNLQAKGYCVGAPGDQIEISEDGFTYEGYHVVNYGTGAIIRAVTTYKASCTSSLHGVLETPGPVSDPPSPAPAPGACPVSPGEVTEWRYFLNPHGGQQVDLTPLACGDTLKSKPGLFCYGYCCPLADEKGPVNAACQDELYGTPNWTVLSGDADLIVPDPTKPFAVKVRAGSGYIASPGSMGAPATRKWAVTATIPPCSIGGDGQCQGVPLQ